MTDITGPVLSAQNLCLRFGAVDALKNVSLSVSAHSIHALIGPNGAGKSSLLNCLSGFYQPYSGAVLFQGRDISRMKPCDRAAIGIGRTFQGLQTYPSMSVRENILTGYHSEMKGGVFAGLFRTPTSRRQEEKYSAKAEAIIEFLELENDRNRPVADLPYGLRKRVDLGRAVALSPKILIMDEPMAGMNPEEKGDLARFILDIREFFEIPVVLVEHDMDVIMDISDQITVLEFGSVIAEGTPAEIAKDPRVIQAYLGEDAVEVAS